MSNHIDHSEKVLLRHIAAGDERAFKSLFVSYRRRLYHYILGMVKSKEVAEEVVLDVFLKLWLGRDTITDIENMDAFLFRIAHNKSIDFLRTASKDAQLSDLLWDKMQLTDPNRPDTILMQQEYELRLREAINLLPGERKKVYKLSREQGLSQSEIAEELEISKKTVNNQIVEAQKFIRSYLMKNLDLAIIIAIISQSLKK